MVYVHFFYQPPFKVAHHSNNSFKVADYNYNSPDLLTPIMSWKCRPLYISSATIFKVLQSCSHFEKIIIFVCQTAKSSATGPDPSCLQMELWSQSAG